MEVTTRGFERSVEWFASASQWTPEGSQTRSKAACRFPFGAYPVAVECGRGAYVWDVDGHRYLDFIGALGAIPLGYGYPAVKAAIAKQLDDGILFGLPHRLEGEVSERFCSRVPCAQNGAVKWLKTGSEACAAAVRMARAYTGRDLVLMADNGYHGWHDWYTVTKAQHPGVPDSLAQGVRTFRYNDLDSLCWTLVRSGHVSAVILEPTLFTSPDDGFLQGVVDLAHQHGAVVIFDEMILGARLAYAGGQEYFGVTPDLATFGKGISGIGYPVACVCGKREIVQCGVTVSGTFGGDALALAAVNATMDVYEREPIIENQWRDGQRIMDGLTRACLSLGLTNVVIDGYPIHPRLTFTGPDGRLHTSVFLQECAQQGVAFHPGGINIPGILMPDQVTDTIGALDNALGAVRIGSPLRGRLVEDAQVRPAGRAA